MANPTKLFLRYKDIFLLTLYIKGFLILFAQFINSDKCPNWYSCFVQWDGPHYIDIAKNGYQTNGQEALWIVFYPLYPIFIKILSFFTNNFYLSAILVSLLFSFLAAILLYEVVLLDFDKKTAFYSVLFLNIYPTAYFLQASYTESLYLTTSLLTIYLFRKNKFTLSGLTGLLTTLTRVNGILLLPVLFIESKKFGKNLLTFLLLPLGTFIYLIINYIYFHSFFYFQKPLSSYWYKHIDFPWNGILNSLSYIQNYKDEVLISYIFEYLVITFLFGVGIYSYFKIRKSYSLYVFLNLFLFTSTSFILSTPRYSLIVFPIFIALAQIKNKLVIYSLASIFILLLLYFTFLYTQGKWAF